MMTKRFAGAYSITVLFLFLTLGPVADSAHADPIPGGINKTYLMLLFVMPYPWPEVVDLHLTDNGTFSLKSDFFYEPSVGKYNKNSFILSGNGISAKYFDKDYDQEVQVSYAFRALSIGFQSFFLLGTGQRNIQFHSDNTTADENFIFQGPGFQRLNQ